MVQSVTVGNGGNKAVPTVHVGNGGTKLVLEGWIGTAGGNEQFFASLSAVKSGDALAVDTTVTNAVTITPSNGATPYSYSWARISGDTTPQINNATSATVTWNVPAPAHYTATWRCTVTDAHGTVVTVDVGVTFTTTG